MIAEFCKCTKCYWVVHSKWVNLMVCEFYLNKTGIPKKKSNIERKEKEQVTRVDLNM